MKDKKRKKEKIRYVDDGRTIADMSGLKGNMDWTKHGTSSRFSDIWKTYWNAVRMMFLPMLVTCGFILLVFLIVTVLFLIMR
ncbi:MAG: hypothetical protein IJF69_03400 [Clostridia bacterium]|nr:hypothetical protein [Clostridia bacterium]